MKKLFATILMLCLLSIFTVSAFAVSPINGTMAESGERNADIAPRTTVHVGGDLGGEWEYGTNLLIVYSRLQTIGWQTRTSVTPGENSQTQTSGFVSAGHLASVSAPRAISGNTANYDLKP